MVEPFSQTQVGTVRGEDYDFQFSGRVREGKLQFRLNLEYVGDDSQQDSEVKEPEAQRCVRPRRFPSSELLQSGTDGLGAYLGSTASLSSCSCAVVQGDVMTGSLTAEMLPAEVGAR